LGLTFATMRSGVFRSVSALENNSDCTFGKRSGGRSANAKALEVKHILLDHGPFAEALMDATPQKGSKPISWRALAFMQPG